MLTEYFEQYSTSKTTGKSQTKEFTQHELNAMRYACGYVPHCLLKRYETSFNEKHQQFVECLENMAVPGEGGDL